MKMKRLVLLVLTLAAFAAVPAAQADPEAEEAAAALFREGHKALNDSNYGQARRLFREVRTDYAQSEVASDAFYWEAFSLYRIGNSESLRTASELLEELIDQRPNGDMAGDARALLGRIDGALAQQGDAQSARKVVESAQSAAERDRDRATRSERGQHQQDDELRIAALNALMQMDEERAIPILKKLLARKDAEDAELRANAVFLVAQHDAEESADILLDVALNDPDLEVREQAVFWLSEVDDERSVDALEGLLRDAPNGAIQEKAVFALSQHDSDRAGVILRDVAADRTRPATVREHAVFWLGQSDHDDAAEFLMGLYKRDDERAIREKIIFSIAQLDADDERVSQFLVDIALDANEDLEMRKQALFWAGEEEQINVAELERFYTTVDDRELRQQVIFVLSQRDEDAAVDALIGIARKEKDVELRKQAIFWLGETDSERAYDFIEELLDQ